MSFALDHVAAVDDQLDLLPISGPEVTGETTGDQAIKASDERGKLDVSPRVKNLQSLIRSLSTKRSLPNPSRLLGLLRDAQLSVSCETCQQYASDYQGEVTSQDAPGASYQHELEWLLIGKITNHAYGLVIDALINQTLTLNGEIWYWSDVLGSARYTGLYSIQSSPLRFWSWSESIYQDVRSQGVGLSQGWHHFYGLVRSAIRDRSLKDFERQVSSPVALVRRETRQKLAALNRYKLLNSSGIGYLLSHGFNDWNMHLGRHDHVSAKTNSGVEHKWKSTVVKSISVMDAVLNTASDDDLLSDEFDNAMTAFITEDPLEDYHRPFSDPQTVSPETLAILLQPSEASQRLEEILSKHLPLFFDNAAARLKINSRPSRLVRYWLPAAALLISSTTILRIAVNRKAEILQWMRDLGSTTVDFWYNWVVEPTKKVIATIRHDEKSGVSIISKRSLEGDLASLERMVVDFAVENPDGPPLNDSDIASIRSKVQEGDLTPVLKVYESQLKSPFYNSIRGKLIQTLLIQVQKTKVDVEVAMGGIDNLLKSQELVFGFVGLTPGVLVCVGVFRWLRNLPTSRRLSQQRQKQTRAFQLLRNIDRILTSSPQTDTGALSFKEYGLLVCEAIILRDVAKRSFPKQTFQEFLQDFQELIDIDSGVGRQIRVADRIRWAYAKWL